jgi:hypothetical protein
VAKQTLEPDFTNDPTYISRPTEDIAEGDLALQGDPQEIREQVARFALQLTRTVLQNSEDDPGPAPALSSLSLQWLTPHLEGDQRLYGQAYAEKRGEVVVFLRIRMYDSRGTEVVTGMATSHVGIEGKD